MTSYEPLRASAPAPAPMAQHLVKWWRNKFRSGYKKFTIDDGERTDTEELVGRAASQCSAPPDLLPSEARAMLLPSTPPPPFKSYKKHSVSCSKGCPPPTEAVEDKHSKLRFEELTCDVELQHSESSKQKPLQFSFTLYDLDGRGRMTKDDIAGIVSTIYESVGKSVTVPQYGSKTIQVRLTVGPEESDKRNKRERKDERNKRNREPPAKHTHIPIECADNVSDDEHQDRSSHDEDASSNSCSGDQKPIPRQAAVTRHRPQRQRRKDHRERRHEKKRSGSLQRRELLEIIQANMEKNRLSFQTTRKPNESAASEEIRNKYQKQRNRSFSISEKPNIAFQKSKPEMNNGYLDIPNAGDTHLCRYDRHLHAVICSSARHAHTGYHHKPSQPTRHARASHPQNGRHRSHDLPFHLQSAQQPRVLQIIFL